MISVCLFVRRLSFTRFIFFLESFDAVDSSMNTVQCSMFVSSCFACKSDKQTKRREKRCTENMLDVKPVDQQLFMIIYAHISDMHSLWSHIKYTLFH